MTPKQAEAAFTAWWYENGSGIAPLDGHDVEEHAERVTRIAWLRAVHESQATFYPHAEYQDPSQSTEGRIAIQGNKLAIFGSPMGYAGPVIQNYVEFDDQDLAIKQAKEEIAALGLPLHEEISRPVITKMSMSTRKAKGKAR